MRALPDCARLPATAPCSLAKYYTALDSSSPVPRRFGISEKKLEIRSDYYPSRETEREREREREREGRDMRLVDQHIHSNLGGHKGTAIQGTKRGAGAFCFQGSIIAIGIVGIAKPPLPCWSTRPNSEF